MNNILIDIDELESNIRESQKTIDFLTSKDLDLDAKTMYDNFIKTQKNEKMKLESLKKNERKLKKQKQSLWEFWTKFFRLLNKVLNVHPKYKNIRINTAGIRQLYAKTHLGISMMLFTNNYNTRLSNTLLFDKFFI